MQGCCKCASEIKSFFGKLTKRLSPKVQGFWSCFSCVSCLTFCSPPELAECITLLFSPRQSTERGFSISCPIHTLLLRLCNVGYPKCLLLLPLESYFSENNNEQIFTSVNSAYICCSSDVFIIVIWDQFEWVFFGYFCKFQQKSSSICKKNLS